MVVMKIPPLPAIISLAVFLASCASPVRYTDKELTTLDKNTKYRIDAHSAGFTATMIYSRYQFVPESNAVSDAAKNNLMALCHDEASKRGKTILPINEQAIRMSMGRNGLTGITSWSGSVSVNYR